MIILFFLNFLTWTADGFILPFIRSKSDQKVLHPPSVINVSPSSSILIDLENFKTDLIRCCNESSSLKNDQIETIRLKVRNLESVSQELGISFEPGLLSGEWKLLFSSDDATRSSPFFWAFRKAFPDKADPIFSITDSIPAPFKNIGPVFQSIDVGSKSWVSKVTVSTLGSEMSVMTTRCTILGKEGVDGLRLKVESTKPEDSSILNLLGPLGKLINDNSPPFPSGQALERVRQGSSEVLVRTTFCDEGLRISRNEDRLDDFFIWVRVGFSRGSEF